MATGADKREVKKLMKIGTVFIRSGKNIRKLKIREKNYVVFIRSVPRKKTKKFVRRFVFQLGF